LVATLRRKAAYEMAEKEEEGRREEREREFNDGVKVIPGPQGRRNSKRKRNGKCWGRSIEQRRYLVESSISRLLVWEEGFTVRASLQAGWHDHQHLKDGVQA